MDNAKYLPIEKPANLEEIWVIVHGVYGKPFKAIWHDGNPAYVVSESGLSYWSYEVSEWKY
jgi:hypothetical protein